MSGSNVPDMEKLNEGEKLPSTPRCPPSINEKALVRKIDFKILPMLFLVYVAAFLDR